MKYGSEAEVYRLVMKSNTPQAEAFQDWVCGEVLPSIRKSGGYIAAQPDETPEMIMAKALQIANATMERQKQQLQEAEETIGEQRVEIQAAHGQIEEQQKRLEHIEPMAQYTREVLQSTSTFTLTQVAKDLGFVSIHKFTDWARERGILYRQSGQWIPNSKHCGNGYFATRTTKFVKSDNTIGTNIYTVVTERGRAWLHQLLAA